MNQITTEELQNLRESIKEGDYLTLDGSYEDMISFEVRVERSGKPIKNTARGVVFFSLQSSNVKILYFYGICQ